jgi:V-type H+-transporting ATPase subunit G
VLIFASDRVQRLKDARTEALKEIEEYKKAKEAEFKAFEASVRRILSS